jgi:hypothetical protein
MRAAIHCARGAAQQARSLAAPFRGVDGITRRARTDAPGRLTAASAEGRLLSCSCSPCSASSSLSTTSLSVVVLPGVARPGPVSPGAAASAMPIDHNAPAAASPARGSSMRAGVGNSVCAGRCSRGRLRGRTTAGACYWRHSDGGRLLFSRACWASVPRRDNAGPRHGRTHERCTSRGIGRKQQLLEKIPSCGAPLRARAIIVDHRRTS